MDPQLLKENIDTDWVELILQAKKLGITKEEVRRFLNNGERCDLVEKK